MTKKGYKTQNVITVALKKIKNTVFFMQKKLDFHKKRSS